MKPQRVLVVDDSPTMTQLLTMTLKRVSGLEVVTARDGVEGLKKLGQAKYDLMFTDINMPVMDGLSFIKSVRGDSNGQNKGIPIIIITTEGEEDARKNGLALGADAYITKPINAREVLETVSRHLSAARK
ncbi:response regulator [bacterium]|nr:response regulator [bacterium]